MLNMSQTVVKSARGGGAVGTDTGSAVKTSYMHVCDVCGEGEWIAPKTEKSIRGRTNETMAGSHSIGNQCDTL